MYIRMYTNDFKSTLILKYILNLTMLTLDCFTLSVGGNWTTSFFGHEVTGGEILLIPLD